MSKKTLRLKLCRLLLHFGMVETDKGTLNYEGELAVGLEVYTEDENGEMIPATDGEYVINEDGRTIVVVDGKVSEIREVVVTETGTTEEDLAEETGVTATTETTEETPDYEQAINTLLEAVEALTERVEAIAADVEELKKQNIPTIEDEFSKVEKNEKRCWERV